MPSLPSGAVYFFFLYYWTVPLHCQKRPGWVGERIDAVALPSCQFILYLLPKPRISPSQCFLPKMGWNIGKLVLCAIQCNVPLQLWKHFVPQKCTIKLCFITYLNKTRKQRKAKEQVWTILLNQVLLRLLNLRSKGADFELEKWREENRFKKKRKKDVINWSAAVNFSTVQLKKECKQGTCPKSNPCASFHDCPDIFCPPSPYLQTSSSVHSTFLFRLKNTENKQTNKYNLSLHIWQIIRAQTYEMASKLVFIHSWAFRITRAVQPRNLSSKQLLALADADNNRVYKTVPYIKLHQTGTDSTTSLD